MKVGFTVGRNVQIDYFDDFNGQPLDANTVDTVTFSYRGNDYSLDLTAEDGAQFDAHMDRYIKAAKKAQARDARAATKKPATARKSTAKPKKIAPAATKPAAKATKTPAAPPKAAAKPAKAAKTPAAQAKATAKPTKAVTQSKASSRSAGAAPTTSDQNRAIREWAIATGRKVSLRGRIAADVVDAYNAAN